QSCAILQVTKTGDREVAMARKRTRRKARIEDRGWRMAKRIAALSSILYPRLPIRASFASSRLRGLLLSHSSPAQDAGGQPPGVHLQRGAADGAPDVATGDADVAAAQRRPAPAAVLL